MTHAKPERIPGRVAELDGIRGVLALWVALAHVVCWSGYMEFFTKPRPTSRLWSEVISAAPPVDIFIILSGFAISFLLHERRQSYAGFMKGRFFRIYPVYLLCLSLGMITMLLAPFILQTAQWRDSAFFEWMRLHSASETTNPGTHFLLHLTLLNGLVPKQVLANSSATLLAPAWSISLEWQYYLVAPLLALLLRSGTGLLLVTGLAWLGLRYGAPWQNPHLSFLPAQLPLFLIGIASYHLYARWRASGTGPSNLFGIPVAGLLTVAVLGSWHVMALAGWAIGFGCIFVCGNDPLARFLSMVRRILLHPLFQGLGSISYPLYLVHWPLIILLIAGLLFVRPGISANQALLLMSVFGLPLILLAATLLHIYVEAPLMAYGKRSKSRTRTTAAAIAEASQESIGRPPRPTLPMVGH